MAPWTGKAGRAKVIAVLAMVLGVSLGLCGLNFYAVLKFSVGKSSTQMQWTDTALEIAAWTELVCIAGSLIGLVLAWLWPRRGEDLS